MNQKNREKCRITTHSLQNAYACDNEQEGEGVVEILKVCVATNVNSVYDPIHKPLKTLVSTGHQVRAWQ